MNEKLAKITKASLEVQDRGILNFWIQVDYEEGCSQGIGGICLDTYDKSRESRVGTAAGCEIIRLLLLTLKVNDFSEMKGKYIWVIGDGDGFMFQPKGLRPLYVDCKGRNSEETKTIIFQDVFDQFKEEQN